MLNATWRPTRARRRRGGLADALPAKPVVLEAGTLLAVTGALAVLLGPGGAGARAQESTPPSRGAAGVTLSPAFRQYADVPPHCCPVGGWVAFGSGTCRLQADYVRSHRRSTGYGGYPIMHEGREASVQRVVALELQGSN